MPGRNACTNAKLDANFADGTSGFDANHTATADQGGPLEISDISIVGGELKVGSKTRMTGQTPETFPFEVRDDFADGNPVTRSGHEQSRWSTEDAVLKKPTASVAGRFHGNSEVGFTYRASTEASWTSP